MKGFLKDRFNKWSAFREELMEWFFREIHLTTQPISLTAGERTLVKGVFGDEIDTGIVMKYMEPKSCDGDDDEDPFSKAGFLGFCIGKKAVAFVGESMHSSDFSRETDALKFEVFMHEMTHIWQNQMHEVVTKKPLGRKYKYSLKEDRKFFDFGLEQQATIMGEYAARFLKPGNPQDSYYSRAIMCRPEDIGSRLQKIVEDHFPQARITRLAVEAQRARKITELAL